MKVNTLGKTNLKVSEISFGASSLGSVFKDIDENEGIQTVHRVIDSGINYIDVAPAYGGTVAETVLGKGLKGINRNKYYLSTKAGKYTNPDCYGDDTFDYTEKTIREGLEQSMKRLGVDYIDIVHLHDFDYCKGAVADKAFETGFPTLLKLKEEGLIGSVGAGIYDMELWKRVIKEAPVDAILLHNHYSLIDTRALELVDSCVEKNIGIINASPFGMGVLTPGPVVDWHPANIKERELFAEAIRYCEENGQLISQLAFQFSMQQDYFATTLFSSSNRKSVDRNIKTYNEPYDTKFVKSLQEMLADVMNKQWDFDAGSGLLPENNK
jgi:aryl-alcohol dehydrogenase-like predicted oxidoreductase